MYQLITINGKELPIRFGMNALRIFGKNTNTSLNDMQNLGADMKLDDSIHLIKAGLEDGHRKAGKPFSITVEDISDWMDDDMDLIVRAMDIFNAQYEVEPVGKSKGGKKKAPKK